jgi:hypothetical protein
MAATSEKLSDLNEWRAVAFQLVAFTQSPAVDLEQNWWTDLTGQDAEQIRKRGLREEKGIIDDFQLSVTTNLIQIVWTALPCIDVAQARDATPNLGPYPQAKKKFFDLMQVWIPKCPEIHRLAFGTKSYLPTNTRDHTYSTVGKYIPSLKIHESAADLLYRINLKRDSGVIKDRKINRVATWQTVKYKMSIETATSGASITRNELMKVDQDALLVDVDINTAGDDLVVIPAEIRLSLLQELSAFTDEIVEKGELL